MKYIKYEEYSLYVYCSSQKDVLSRRKKAENGGLSLKKQINVYFLKSIKVDHNLMYLCRAVLKLAFSVGSREKINRKKRGKTILKCRLYLEVQFLVG
jgi:hypothetical protein